MLVFPMVYRPSYPLQDAVGHGGIGIDDDGGSLVISNLFEEGSRVLAVIQHTNRECFLGNEKLSQ